jgi:hypothetical protein
MTPAQTLAWAVALLLVSVFMYEVFGIGRFPQCLFCGSRFNRHSDDCPWKEKP